MGLYSPLSAMSLIIENTTMKNRVCHHCHLDDKLTVTEETEQYIEISCGGCGSKARLSFDVIMSFVPLSPVPAA